MLPDIQFKIKCFEYLTQKLVQWHNEVSPNVDIKTSFNKLKLIKLNFFVSAVDANNDNNGLLDIFDNFHALPLGHVESNIYNNLADVKTFNVTKSDFTILSNVGDDYFNEIQSAKSKIDSSVNSLRRINEDLVKYSALDLVEISHLWYSWCSTFEMARSLGKYSLKIPIEMIKKENKIFKLN